MRQRAAILACALIAAALACNTPAAQPVSGTPAPGVSKPTVEISSPATGAQITAGQTVQVESLSKDDIGVSRVDLQVDGAVVRSDTAPDPSGQKTLALLQNWMPSQPGSHTITLFAYRADGTASDPASITVTVVAATGGPELTPTSGPCTAQATTDLNVRGGPSTVYPILGVIPVGKSAPVTGRNADTSWYQIGFAPGVDGWVSVTYVSLSGDCSSVPTASYSPPPPTKIPTPTLTPTPSASNTPTPPDLIVTDIDMTSPLVLTGNKVTTTIRVTIENVGGQIATGFKVYLYPTGPNGSAGQIDLGTVASLHPDETLTLSTDYGYSAVGTYTVQATVDPEDTVAESDEGNNIRTLSIQVLAPTPTATGTP